MAACLFLPVTQVTKSASVKAINDQFKMSAVFRQLHVRTVPATSAPFYITCLFQLQLWYLAPENLSF